jgi:hypothetical protein
VLELRKEGVSADLEKLGSRPRSITPFSPFLFPFKPLSYLDSNLNAVSNLKLHPNKLQINPKELQVSHTNIFLYFLGISFSSKINLGIKGEERKTSLNNLIITQIIHRKF